MDGLYIILVSVVTCHGKDPSKILYSTSHCTNYDSVPKTFSSSKGTAIQESECQCDSEDAFVTMSENITSEPSSHTYSHL